MTMEEAARILDVAERHSYVFDQGLCSPEFFDLEARLSSIELGLIRGYCERHHSILEVGCLTGMNLLALHRFGYVDLTGIDFVKAAIEYLNIEAEIVGANIETIHGDFNHVFRSPPRKYDRVILFDVLEHQLNPGTFLENVAQQVASDGEVLILVPEGKYYLDCGHVAFYPTPQCLQNLLNYFFVVKTSHVTNNHKIFAHCCRR